MTIRWSRFATWIGAGGLLAGGALLVPACGGSSATVATVTELPGAQVLLDAVLHAPGSTVTFHGQGVDPGCGAVAYSWDLNGDGVEDSTTSSPTFTYATAGEFEALLRVTNADGGVSTATAIVSVRAAGPAAPGVSLRSHALFGEAGAVVHFLAVAAHSGGAVASYDWDLDGNGTFELSTPTGETTGTYLLDGVFEVRVRANGAGGLSSIARLTLVLCQDGALPEVGPSALIEEDPLSASHSRTVAGTLGLRAFGVDIDGGACTYLWDLDGNGVFETPGRAVTATWGTAGPVVVALQVMDDEGHMTIASATLSILPALPGPANPPEVLARATTTLASVGVPVTFQALATDREDGPGGLLYAWDFDGDGLTDAALPTATFTFTEPGGYLPECRVTDTAGNVAWSYLGIEVQCCPDGTIPTTPPPTITPPPPPPPPPGAYFWCDCEPVTISHGATATVVIPCPVSIGGSLPATSQIVNINGSPGLFGDPFGSEITVTDQGGNVVPPFPALVNPTGLGPFFTVTSDDVDGPPRTVCYTISIRLRDPGVRTQILKCRVCVRHGHVRCALNSFGTPTTTGLLTVEADVVFGPPLPAIHQVEVRFAEQTPPWQLATPGALPLGWSAQVLPDRIQFFLQNPGPGVPITAGGGPFPFQLLNLQTVGGGPPTAGHVRCFGGPAQPGLVSREHIDPINHTP